MMHYVRARVLPTKPVQLLLQTGLKWQQDVSYRSGQQEVETLANQLLRQTSERVSDRLTSYLQPAQQLVAVNRYEVTQGMLNLTYQEQLRQQLWQQITLNPDLPSIGFGVNRARRPPTGESYRKKRGI